MFLAGGNLLSESSGNSPKIGIVDVTNRDGLGFLSDEELLALIAKNPLREGEADRAEREAELAEAEERAALEAGGHDAS